MTQPYIGNFRITSGYGYRIDPITGESGSWHGGLDLVGDEKSVVSVCSGAVVRSRMVTDKSDRTSEWGNYIAVQSKNGEVVYYCHLSERLVEYGEEVHEGQVIGVEGSTGKSTGSHLHFEVRVEGKQVNAAEYLGLPNEVGFEYTAKSVEKGRWSDAEVKWAIESGIMRGDVSGDLRLSSPCTREETAVMLYRLHELMKREMKGGIL